MIGRIARWQAKTLVPPICRQTEIEAASQLSTALSGRLQELPALSQETALKMLNLPAEATVAEIYDSYRLHSSRLSRSDASEPLLPQRRDGSGA